MSHKVLFVHGFGVRKDARGFFTDIKNVLERGGFECILTNLNQIPENSSDLILNPLSKQAEILQKTFQENCKEGDVVDIIAHSQGCVVAALTNLPNIRKVILITPPTNSDMQKTLEYFKSRPDTVINFEGESYITRADGSRTVAFPDYWADRREMVYLDEYKKLSAENNLIIIIANQDETVGNEAVEDLKKLGRVICLDGDHNFTEESRGVVLKEIENIIFE